MPVSYRDDMSSSPLGGVGGGAGTVHAPYQHIQPSLSPLSGSYNGYSYKDNSSCSQMLSPSGNERERHHEDESPSNGGCHGNGGLDGSVLGGLGNVINSAQGELGSHMGLERKILTNLDTYKDTYMKDNYGCMRGSIGGIGGGQELKDKSPLCDYGMKDYSNCGYNDNYGLGVKSEGVCYRPGSPVEVSSLGVVHPHTHQSHMPQYVGGMSGGGGHSGGGYSAPSYGSVTPGMTQNMAGTHSTNAGAMSSYNHGGPPSYATPDPVQGIPSSPSAGTTFPSNSCMYSPWGAPSTPTSLPPSMAAMHGTAGGIAPHLSPPGVGAAAAVTSVPLKPSPIIMTTATSVSLPSTISTYALKGRQNYLTINMHITCDEQMRVYYLKEELTAPISSKSRKFSLKYVFALYIINYLYEGTRLE